MELLLASQSRQPQSRHLVGGQAGPTGRPGQMNLSWPLRFSFLSEECLMGRVSVQGHRAQLAHP